MASNPLSQASAYASQFLSTSFAPYHSQGPSSDAPLFFSTVDGEAVAVLDSDHGQLLPRAAVLDGERTFGQSYYNPFRGGGGRGTIDEAEEDDDGDGDGDDGNGLGTASSSYPGLSDGSDDHEVASVATSDPFKQSDNLHKRAPSLSAASKGWRMHTPSILSTGIKQSIINDMYDLAESVKSSFFKGHAAGGNEKGKQRAAGHPELQMQESQMDSPPEFLVVPARPPLTNSQQPPDQLPSNGASPILALPYASNDSLSVIPQAIASTRTAFTLTDHSPIRYPLPTSVYRRRLPSARAGPSTHFTSTNSEWQDQSLRDYTWLVAYLVNLLFSTCLGIYLSFFSHSPPSPILAGKRLFTPSLALLQSLPLLFLLTGLTALSSATVIGYLVLLRSSGARQILHLFTILPPILLLVAASWAFSASYSDLSSSYSSHDGLEPVDHATTWAQSVLRTSSLLIVSITLLSLRYYFVSSAARMERTIRVVQVASEVLILHPGLFVLAFLGLGTFVVSTVPAVLLVSKLLVHGHALSNDSNGRDAQKFAFFIPSTMSIILALHTAFVLLWTLSILRGILKHTIAGTVAEWWFHRHSPAPSSILGSSDNLNNDNSGKIHKVTRYTNRRAAATVQFAFARATGPSLGTICASSLVLAIFTLLSTILSICNSLIVRSRRWTASSASTILAGFPNLVARLSLNLILLPLVAVLGGLLHALNDFALVHSAISGDSFWTSSKEARDLITGRQGTDIVIGREYFFLSAYLTYLKGHQADPLRCLYQI